MRRKCWGCGRMICLRYGKFVFHKSNRYGTGQVYCSAVGGQP